MKSYLLILICAISLISLPGCKKKSFDPTSKSLDDFIGTWGGSISTFKNNQLLKEYGTMVIYPDAGNMTLSGILFMKEILVFHEFQFVDGTLYFKIDNNDPDNPYCQNWSLGGYAVFVQDGEIDVHITGNECGPHGSEFISWVGSMIQSQTVPDSLKCYNFAKNGNSWNYKVTFWTGDSCEVQKQVNEVSATYLFGGLISQTCGWTGQNMAFKWDVTPARFSIVNDTTLSAKPVTFPINAKLGVVYNSYINNDTITVTILDTNLVITTPAGVFSCVRFKYTEPVYSGSIKTQKTAYIWLNNRYGIIKQQVATPLDISDIRYQVLISKNF